MAFDARRFGVAADRNNQFASRFVLFIPPVFTVHILLDVFRAPPRIDLLHRNTVWQEVYKKIQLTKMLTRAEMPGGGKKPWPQVCLNDFGFSVSSFLSEKDG